MNKMSDDDKLIKKEKKAGSRRFLKVWGKTQGAMATRNEYGSE